MTGNYRDVVTRSAKDSPSVGLPERCGEDRLRIAVSPEAGGTAEAVSWGCAAPAAGAARALQGAVASEERMADLPDFTALPQPETPATDLIQRAVLARASDIHLEPYGDEVELRFRIDGQMEHIGRLSCAIAFGLMNQLKLMANLDISEPFRPKEGRLQLPGWLSTFEARITTAHVAGGETMAIRLLNRDQIIRPLSNLGFSGHSFRLVEDLLHHGEGLVLVTGPAGSGKTTTMYSLIHALDNGHRNIVSIEDPVEFNILSIQQMEVDPRHDVTFPSGLRTLLRLDPDIVMVGEIRDPETAAVAMRAASSGKYVFSSFHTRDVASTITAIRDLGIKPQSVAGNLRGIVSQRLVRRLCTHCRDFVPITDEQQEIFSSQGITAPTRIAIPVGCSACRQRGYFDRIGVFEIEANNSELCEAIENGAAEDKVRQVIRSGSGLSLLQDALLKAAEGVTSLEEVRGLTWVPIRSGRDS